MAFNLKLVRNSHSLWRILYSTIRSIWGPRRFSWSSLLSNIISWIVPLRSTHFNLHPLPNMGDWFSLLVEICLSPFNNWIVWCPQVLPSSQNPDYLLFYFLLKKKKKKPFFYLLYYPADILPYWSRHTIFQKLSMYTGRVLIRYARCFTMVILTKLKSQLTIIYSLRFLFPFQEYSRSQITGLINLVATMKGWKRKTRLEVLEKVEAVTVWALYMIFISQAPSILLCIINQISPCLEMI